MENHNNTTQTTPIIPGFTRKTVLRPKPEMPVTEFKAADPIPETKAAALIKETKEAVMESENVNGNTDEVKSLPEIESMTSAPGCTEEETDEWESFMENLGNYESRGRRENRTPCRLDCDIADALYELDINGSSRPDIVSAVMRGFLLRNKERLFQLRRAKSSFFETK